MVTAIAGSDWLPHGQVMASKGLLPGIYAQ